MTSGNASNSGSSPAFLRPKTGRGGGLYICGVATQNDKHHSEFGYALAAMLSPPVHGDSKSATMQKKVQQPGE